MITKLISFTSGITLRLTIVVNDSVFMGLLWYHFVFTGNERDYDKEQVLLRKLILGVCFTAVRCMPEITSTLTRSVTSS